MNIEQTDEAVGLSGKTYGCFCESGCFTETSLDPWELIDMCIPLHAEFGCTGELWVGHMRTYGATRYVGASDFASMVKRGRLTVDGVLEAIDEAQLNESPLSVDDCEMPILRDDKEARREFRRVLRGLRRRAGATPGKEKLHPAPRHLYYREGRKTLRDMESYDGLHETFSALAKWVSKYIKIEPSSWCHGDVRVSPIVLCGAGWSYGLSRLQHWRRELQSGVRAEITYFYDAGEYRGEWRWTVPSSVLAGAGTGVEGIPLFGSAQSLAEAQCAAEKALAIVGA